MNKRTPEFKIETESRDKRRYILEELFAKDTRIWKNSNWVVVDLVAYCTKCNRPYPNCSGC